MKVLAKFFLAKLSQHKSWQAPYHAVTVDLSAVQGEPFGSATPSGNITMTIANPEAGQVFLDAWHEYTHGGQNEKAPEFLLTFERATPETH